MCYALGEVGRPQNMEMIYSKVLKSGEYCFVLRSGRNYLTKMDGRFTYAKLLSCDHDVKFLLDECTTKTVPTDESEKRL